MAKQSKRKIQASIAFPSYIKPMLATLTKEPFNNLDWIFEVKWDGYRVIAYLNKGVVKLLSRAGQNYTKSYPLIVEDLKKLKHDAVVDGEIVVFDETGKPNFDELQRYNGDLPLTLYVFDLLWLDDENIMTRSLVERKKRLEEIIQNLDHVRYTDHFEDGVALFDRMKDLDLEGMIAKKKTSIYRPGIRSNDWLKIQTAKRQEFVVGGWTESTSGRTFRSLIFGWYINGDLHYVGHAGHGFKDAQMPQVMARLKKLEIKKKPFVDEPDVSTKAHWIKPELVIDVKFATFTRIGKIRKPAIFLGFRTDKKPQEIIKEGAPDPAPTRQTRTRKIQTSKDSNWPIIEKQKITSEDTIDIEGNAVRLTNVERNLWGNITKADLIRYYHSVSDYLLPHLKDRPLSLHIKHIAPTVSGLYIKDMEGRQPPYAELFTTPRKHKKAGKRNVIDYLVCNNLATLLYVINLGCIDLNPWTSRIHDPLHPDYIVIDLDPSDNDFKKAVEVALACKETFDKNKLKVFPKTSGKTGIHMFIPCTGFTFPQARDIAENLCQQVHELVPSITTTAVEIERRGNKLYLDSNQNDEADTVAAVFSVRPHSVPTVSMPLEWKEINARLDPTTFRIDNVEARLKKRGDLFMGTLNKNVATKNAASLKKML